MSLHQREAVMSESDPNSVAPDMAGAASPEPMGDPAARIAALEAEVAELKDRALRAQAELENFRRRAERERDDTAKFAVTKFARDLLSVADNLRRAIDNAP